MIKLKKILNEQAKAALGVASKLVSSPNPIDFFNVRQIHSMLQMKRWNKTNERQSNELPKLGKLATWQHPKIKGYYIYTTSGTDKNAATYTISDESLDAAIFEPLSDNGLPRLKSIATNKELDEFEDHLKTLLRLYGPKDKSTNRPY